MDGIEGFAQFGFAAVVTGFLLVRVESKLDSCVGLLRELVALSRPSPLDYVEHK